MHLALYVTQYRYPSSSILEATALLEERYSLRILNIYEVSLRKTQSQTNVSLHVQVYWGRHNCSGERGWPCCTDGKHELSVRSRATLSPSPEGSTWSQTIRATPVSSGQCESMNEASRIISCRSSNAA